MTGKFRKNLSLFVRGAQLKISYISTESEILFYHSMITAPGAPAPPYPNAPTKSLAKPPPPPAP